MKTPNTARLFATLILMVLMIGAGIGVPFALAGNLQTTGQICLGSIGVGVLVLVVGAFFTARQRD
ncbi:MAG: hypothetical protein MUF87_13670 [Anaerolineae bacterium]|jgi:high-affinity Fe2+/Pb2+ permease|nr:hypothetical protein [Anaerolineae bacterium]